MMNSLDHTAPTARVLANVVDQLDGIDMADSDTSRRG